LRKGIDGQKDLKGGKSEARSVSKTGGTEGIVRPAVKPTTKGKVKMSFFVGIQENPEKGPTGMKGGPEEERNGELPCFNSFIKL